MSLTGTTILGIATLDLSNHPLQEIPDFGFLFPVSIANKALTPQDFPAGSHPLFHGDIEWLGPLEPGSPMPGLKIFSDIVFFYGLRSEILTAFAQYRGNANLGRYVGAFLEPETLLIVEGGKFLVHGSGGISCFRPASGKDFGLESDIVHYKSGNSFMLDIESIRLQEHHYFGKNNR